VEEFRIFHRELKDFFNASTVTDRMEKLLREGDAPQSVRDAAKSFADAKARCDGIRDPEGPALLAAVEEALARLSEARRAIDRELTEGGLREANADQRQQWRLAEIGLEDYAFVLLSRGINALGAEADPPRNEMSAAEQRAALLFLAAAADAVAVSAGGGGGEFAGVAHEASELAVSGPGGMPPGGEEGALRSRAVAERARRAAEDHCAMLSDLFDGRAGALGRALGIDQHVVEVFTEGQIRASVVFQSAKLASHLLRAARAATGEAGWDCIVPGEVKGARLVCVDRLLPTDPTIASLSASDPAIVCVASADGDEEVTTCGPGVVGILLCHALPHLSHLALRARQAQTPLVAIEDPNLAAKARALADAPGVHLKAAPSAISLDACEGGYVGGGGGGGGGGALSSRVAAALVADTSAAGQVIDLRDLGAAEWSRAVAVAGSKATACASLSALAAESGAFAAPAGAVLPFGSFELACKQAGADGRLAFLLDALESVAGDATQTAQICDELQSLARATRPVERSARTAQRAVPSRVAHHGALHRERRGPRRFVRRGLVRLRVQRGPARFRNARRRGGGGVGVAVHDARRRIARRRRRRPARRGDGRAGAADARPGGFVHIDDQAPDDGRRERGVRGARARARRDARVRRRARDALAPVHEQARAGRSAASTR
jgi:phosphoglucan,water dikinase